MADENRASTAGSQTSALQGDILATRQFQLAERKAAADMATDKAMLGIEQEREKRLTIEAQQQLELQKQQLEESKRQADLQADTQIQREGMVQQGWRENRAHEDQQLQKRLKADQEAQAKALAHAAEQADKERKEARDQIMIGHMMETEQRERAYRTAKAESAHALKVIEVGMAGEQAKTQRARAKRNVINEISDVAKRQNQIGTLVEVGTEAAKGAFENLDTLYRTSTQQPKSLWGLWSGERKSLEGMSNDLVDYLISGGMYMPNGEIRITGAQLDNFRNQMDAYTFQAPAGSMSDEEQAAARERALIAGQARKEIGDGLLDARGRVIAPNRGTGWAHPNYSEGKALKPAEILEIYGAVAASAMGDSELGKKLGDPAMIADLHDGWRTLMRGVDSGDLETARQVIKTKILDKGYGATFSRYVEGMGDILKERVKVERELWQSTGAGGKKELIDQIGEKRGEAMQGMMQAERVLTASITAMSELGVISTEESAAQLEAAVEHIQEMDDPSLITDDVLSAVEYYPDLKRDLERWIKSSEAVEDNMRLFRELEAGGIDANFDLAEENLEGWRDLGQQMEQRMGG